MCTINKLATLMKERSTFKKV